MKPTPTALMEFAAGYVRATAPDLDRWSNAASNTAAMLAVQTDERQRALAPFATALWRALLEVRNAAKQLDDALLCRESAPELSDGDVAGLFEAANDPATLRYEHAYNEYVAGTRQAGAMPFEVWLAVRIEQPEGITEDGMHAAFEQYGAGRAERGEDALPMRLFAPVWLRALREGMDAGAAQAALRAAEAEHFTR